MNRPGFGESGLTIRCCSYEEKQALPLRPGSDVYSLSLSYFDLDFAFSLLKIAL